jgi:hypothetical protein
MDGIVDATKANLWVETAKEAAAKGDMGAIETLGTLKAGETKVMTMSVYMPTSVGNEANQTTNAEVVKAEGAPTLYIGLGLVATQADSKLPGENATKISNGFYKDEAEKAFYVTNADGFVAFTNYKQSMRNSTVYICSNIDLAGKTVTSMDGANDIYAGMKIDGQNFVISNMVIKSEGTIQGGLFTRITQIEEIKDITFDKAVVDREGIYAAVVVGQVYNDLVLDNVDVTNSSVSAPYKVAALVGAVYDEKPTVSKTVTLRNCDVVNTTITATQLDFGTCGLVAFVYADDGEKLVLENCTISDSTLVGVNQGGYDYNGWAYYMSENKQPVRVDEVEGFTVINCTKVEAK